MQGARARSLAVFLTMATAGLLGWRPGAAAACDNFGNIALARGADAVAVRWFDRGLAIEPQWRFLREDRARALLTAQPRAALADFESAACGSPCWEGAGEAQLRLGDVRAAIGDFVRAGALTKLDEVAGRLTAAGDFSDAVAAERELAQQFSANALDQAQLAQTLWQIGRIEELAGWKVPPQAAAYRAAAIASYAKAAKLAPLNESYLLSYGMAEMQWGARASARRAFEHLLQLHPHQSDAENALRKLNAVSPDGAR